MGCERCGKVEGAAHQVRRQVVVDLITGGTREISILASIFALPPADSVLTERVIDGERRMETAADVDAIDLLARRIKGATEIDLCPSCRELVRA